MSNYRIVRVSGIFGGKGVLAYENDPELTNKSYDEQLELLFNQGTVYSCGFIEAMNSLGNDVKDLFFDAEILQKCWAKENTVKYHPDRWEEEILLSQLKIIKPDIVFLASNELSETVCLVKNWPNCNLIDIIKDQCPSVKLVGVFSGASGSYKRVYNADILFAGSPLIFSEYQDVGLSPFLLYHSFDNIFVKKHELSSETPIYDFTFCGFVPFGLGKSSHDNRYYVLSELLNKTKIALWTHEYNIEYGKYENDGIKLNLSSRPSKNNISIKHQSRKIIMDIFRTFNSDFLTKLKSYQLIPRKVKNILQEILDGNRYSSTPTNSVRPKPSLRFLFPNRTHLPVYGYKMYEILNQSKIVFNIHGDNVRDVVGNMRMFEATGVGTCLLTDTGNNMSDLFEEDKEVVTYRTVDEAVEKANYLLDHPDEAEQIAKAGQARTLRDHTIMNRVQQIDEVIQKFL